MNTNEDTGSRSADSKYNPGKKSNPSVPISDLFFQADKPPVSDPRDAEINYKTFTSAILSFGVKPINVSDEFKDEDIPEENLF